MTKTLWAVLLSALFLASCGGGGSDTQASPGAGTALAAAPMAKVDDAACSASSSEAARTAGGDCVKVFKPLAPQAALVPQAASITPTALFNWAQSVFPQFFAGSSVNGTIGPFTYRYYYGTDTYLAVDTSNDVYVLGPLSDYDLMYVGPLSAFACSVSPSSCEVPGNASTGYSLAVGSYLTSSIDYAGDTDWFAISLTAGRTYTFDLQGSASGAGTLSDPILQLFDGGGTQRASNDDIATGNRDSRITYTAPASGTYYLVAGAYSTYTGSYRLSASLVSSGGGSGGGGGGGSINWTSAYSAEEFANDSPTLAAYGRQGWSFSVSGGSIAAELIFASQYRASLYIMPQSYLSACVNGGGFQYYTEYSFDGQYGYQSFTLPVGNYGVCMVNDSATTNATRFELQYQPTVSGFRYSGPAFNSVVQSVSPGGWLIQPVTAGATWRTIVDGANTGGEVYIIPANQQSAFASGGSFTYMTGMDCGNGANRASPGLCEITGVGDYAIAYRNTTGSPQTIVMVGRNYVPN